MQEGKRDNFMKQAARRDIRNAQFEANAKEPAGSGGFAVLEDFEETRGAFDHQGAFGTGLTELYDVELIKWTVGCRPRVSECSVETREALNKCCWQEDESSKMCGEVGFRLASVGGACSMR